MIAHLSGTLLFKEANSVIVDVSGAVGYDVNVPLSTFYDLGDEVPALSFALPTSRKCVAALWFKDSRERQLFVNFISVSGIGQKLGITLLSGMTADEMIAPIREQQPRSLAI